VRVLAWSAHDWRASSSFLISSFFSHIESFNALMSAILCDWRWLLEGGCGVAVEQSLESRSRSRGRRDAGESGAAIAWRACPTTLNRDTLSPADNHPTVMVIVHSFCVWRKRTDGHYYVTLHSPLWWIAMEMHSELSYSMLLYMLSTCTVNIHNAVS
jgi:hypothetical protein